MKKMEGLWHGFHPPPKLIVLKPLFFRFSVALSLVYVEIKNTLLRRFFSAVIAAFWNEWELRSTVVLSLLLQHLLLCSGNIRKKYRGRCIPIIEAMVWLVYLLAVWMATVVLSNLLRAEPTDPKIELVLWISFVLWHLGSPYNITACTVEDNELWLRHLFGLLAQVGEALYICIKFRLPKTSLNYVATPIFIAGVLRYLERVLALKSASKAQLRNSLTSRKDTRGEAAIIRASRVSVVVPNVTYLREAKSSHIILQHLLTHLPFGVDEEAHDNMVFTRSKSADEAFRLVGTESHFFHDLLYTKIPIRRSNKKLSFNLRIFSFLSVVSALVGYTLINCQRIKLNPRTECPDIAVTYLLLFGAILLEGYAFYVDALDRAWTRNRLLIPQKWLNSKLESRTKRGMKIMGQLDLLDFYIKVRTSKLARIFWRFILDNKSLMFWYSQWNPIDPDLKEFIHSRLKTKRDKCFMSNFDLKSLSKLLDEFKVGEVFNRVCEEKSKFVLQHDEWEIGTTDFTRFVFLWHIATTLVYNDDVDQHRIGMGGPFRKIGKSLSDYMMYLAVARPLMLPLGFTEATNRDTYKLFDNFNPTTGDVAKLKDQRKLCTSALLNYNPNMSIGFFPDKKMEFAANFSEFSNGCIFANKLLHLVKSERWDQEEIWEFISEVWMEMLTDAANCCSWKEHAEALRTGGELLTHVSLLMAHFGLTTKIRKGSTIEGAI